MTDRQQPGLIALQILLGPPSRRLLTALAKGATLKAHRYESGDKSFQLHPLEGAPLSIPRRVIDRLEQAGLIESNMKFPAAVYLLTEQGRDAAARIAGHPVRSLGVNRSGNPEDRG